MKYAETFALGEISFGRVAELVEQYVVLIFCDLFPQYAGELTPVDSFCLLLMKVLTIFFSFAARKVGLPARFRQYELWSEQSDTSQSDPDGPRHGRKTRRRAALRHQRVQPISKSRCIISNFLCQSENFAELLGF